MNIVKFQITNFRSLVDFKVDDFSITTVFYGENNAGKSNILKALELIFQRKVQYQDGDFTQPVNFYEGIIKDFSNNFYNNNKALTISFSVEIAVRIEETEIRESIKDLFKVWPESLIFSVEGIITNSKLGNDFAEIHTKNIKVNEIIIYDNDLKTVRYFPSLQLKGGKNPGDLSQAFSHFINPLNDCVYIISSTRHTHSTKFDSNILSEFLPSELIKSLYSLSMTEKTHSKFEQISAVFNKGPFSFGSLSFAAIGGDLELMINSGSVRLPLKHLGSGVEQILSIVASLISINRRIACIEELEQNLSPRLQYLALRKIQSMFTEHLDQLIISSHSSVFAKPKLSDAIYLIEKKEGKTVIVEKFKKKVGTKIKKHFIDAALPNSTYTDEELKANYELVAKITEGLFKR